MPIIFEDNYLRFEEPQFVLPRLLGIPEGFEPMGTRYPIEEIGLDILHFIAIRGWDLPGIDVVMRSYGPADNPYMAVSSISGGKKSAKWRVGYGQPEFTNGKNLLCTGVSKVHTPGQEFSLYSDGSGPSLYRYAGFDWAEDEDRFMNSIKVNSKYRGEDKWYLKYKNRKGVMVVDTDLDREYDWEPRRSKFAFSARRQDAAPELPSLTLKEMFAQADTFLEKILGEIAKFPLSEGHALDNLEKLARVEIQPAPDNLPLIIVSQKIYSRADDGAVVPGTGMRLCSLSTPNDPKMPFPERAYDGFSYGYAQDPYHSETSGLDYPGSRDTQIFKVCLKSANDIFVVDQDAYLSARTIFSMAAKAEGRDRLTEKEVNKMTASFARTMVPLADYKGDYRKPAYLIGRPLGPDEAQEITDLVRRLNPESRYEPHLDFSLAVT